MNLRASLQKAQAWRLFSRREEAASAGAIIKWWELRRMPYNLVVGAVGVFTCVVTVGLAALAADKLGEPPGSPDGDSDLPITVGLGVIAWGIGANVCFTGGWIAELAARWIWKEKAGHFGPISFSLGLLFSIALTLAPAVLFGGFFLLSLLFQ